MLALAGAVACGVPGMADLRPGIVRHETPDQIRARFHGPRVSLRTIGSRWGISSAMSLDDSAYVLMGTITESGVLRIHYPLTPDDTVRLGRVRRFEGPTAPSWPAGFVFVIASAAPLRVDRISEDNRWSSFDVLYDNNAYDPRPAITDLAAAIATDIGQVSIAHAAYGWGTSQQQIDELRWRMRGGRPPPER